MGKISASLTLTIEQGVFFFLCGSALARLALTIERGIFFLWVSSQHV